MDVMISAERNVGGRTHERGHDWAALVQELQESCREWGDIVTEGFTLGRWEGITEESYTVVFHTENGIAQGDVSATLGYLARKYRQEAIALLIGATEFVSGGRKSAAELTGPFRGAP